MDQSPHLTTEKTPLVVKLLAAPVSRYIILAVVLLVVITGGVIWYWNANQTVVDRQLVDHASFSVYAPHRAPAGYQVRQEPASLDNGILNYGFSNDEGQAITVTVQAKPAEFSMPQLSEGGSINTVSTPIGPLYNLSVGATSQYLLDSGDSLIYITSPDNIASTTVNDLAHSLSKIN